MNPDSTSDGDSEANESDGSDGSDEAVTRRTFMRATAGTAAAAGAAVAGSDEGDAQAQTYRFGGEVQGWQGRAPSSIEGQTNPTIELEAGTEYELWFENLDGAPHNIAVRDGDGNTVVESDTISEQGATTSVTFTATSAMAQYVCIIHPTTMVGDLEVAGQAASGEGGGGFQIGFGTAVFVAAMFLAFVSPLLFAVFLFSRRGGGEGETPAR